MWNIRAWILVAQLVKNPPAVPETWVWSLGWEDPLEKGKAAHSSIPAWRVPWTALNGVAKSRTRWSDFHSHFVAQRDTLELHPSRVPVTGGQYFALWTDHS